MSDPNNPPTPGALDVIRGALTASGFQADEAGALIDQAIGARAPAPPPAPTAPRTTSTPAAAAGAKSYTVAELREIAGALGIAPGALPGAASGPPITSRATPPPTSAPTDDTPILSMSDSDRRALAQKIGDVPFANRLLKEMVRDNVKVRPRSR